MATRATVARTLHDVGLAAWFGGALMGAIGVNGAAADVDDPRSRARVANAGWDRWTPVNAIAIGAHLTGAVMLTWQNKGRVASQKGVTGMSVAKAGLTAAALGLTAYSRLEGRTIKQAGDVPVAGGTEPLPETPPEVASAQKQLKALQWAIPGVTGSLLALSSLAGEQQRPTEVAKGLAGRAAQAVTKGPAVAAAAKATKKAADLI